MDPARRLENQGRNPARLDLTEREMEILYTLLQFGGSTKETARHLELSRHTIRNVRSICYGKLGVSSAWEAWAALGWTRRPPSPPR